MFSFYSKTDRNLYMLRIHVRTVYDFSAEVETYSGATVVIGGNSKADKILGGRYFDEINFVGRENLRDGLEDIAELFDGVYRRAKTEKAKQHMQKCIERLNKYEDGGHCVMEKLQEMIDSSVKWIDTPAKRVVLPAPLERFEDPLVEIERVLRRRAFANRSTSITYISIIEHPGEDGDYFEAELVMKKKPKPDNHFLYGEPPSDIESPASESKPDSDFESEVDYYGIGHDDCWMSDEAMSTS